MVRTEAEVGFCKYRVDNQNVELSRDVRKDNLFALLRSGSSVGLKYYNTEF